MPVRQGFSCAPFNAPVYADRRLVAFAAPTITLPYRRKQQKDADKLKSARARRQILQRNDIS